MQVGDIGKEEKPTKGPEFKDIAHNLQKVTKLAISKLSALRDNSDQTVKLGPLAGKMVSR